MKLPSLLVALLSAAAPLGAAGCDFCPGGVPSENSELVVVGTDGETCGSLAEADYEDYGEWQCAVIQDVCCPEKISKSQVEEEGEDGDGEDGEEDGGTTFWQTGDADPPADENPNPPPGTEAEEATGEDTGPQEIPDVGDPCPFCPSGLTADPGTVIPYPEARGATCGMVTEYAANTDAGSANCAEMQEAEAICCPDAEEAKTEEKVEIKTPCTVCPGGLTADGDTQVGQGTCDDLVEEAANFEESSDTCANMREAESTCCPEKDEIEDEPAMCSVCPDGLTAEGDKVIGGRDYTCDKLLEDASETEADDKDCADMKGAQVLCCPSPADYPCPVCPNGLTKDGETSIGGGLTCADMKADALNTEDGSDLCEQMMRDEETCCPPVPDPAETPCAVCPDGLTVDESTVIGRGATCADMMADALATEEDDRECEDLQEAAGTYCCPPPAEAPCPVCPGGLTVAGATVISQGGGRTFTCGGLVTDALSIEEGSRTCEDMLTAENLCCPEGGAAEGTEDAGTDEPGAADPVEEVVDPEEPTEGVDEPAETVDPGADAPGATETADDACVVCPQGLVRPALPIDDGRTTCKGALLYAEDLAAASVECADLQAWEEACCPPPAESPCPVCPDGLTVDGDTVASASIGTSVTCVDVMADALYVEGGTGACDQMMPAEALCCPATGGVGGGGEDTGTPTAATPFADTRTTPAPAGAGDFEFTGELQTIPTPSPTWGLEVETPSPEAAATEDLPEGSEPVFVEPAPSASFRPGARGAVWLLLACALVLA